MDPPPQKRGSSSESRLVERDVGVTSESPSNEEVRDTGESPPLDGEACLDQGPGFRVQGSGCRVQGAGCRVQGAGCRVQGAGFRVQGSGFRFQVSGWGLGFRVQVLGVAAVRRRGLFGPGHTRHFDGNPGRKKKGIIRDSNSTGVPRS